MNKKLAEICKKRKTGERAPPSENEAQFLSGSVAMFWVEKKRKPEKANRQEKPYGNRGGRNHLGKRKKTSRPV